MTLRQQHHAQWDPKNFEIRTLSVERQLEQLVKQVLDQLFSIVQEKKL
jgi:hypothetical protein